MDSPKLILAKKLYELSKKGVGGEAKNANELLTKLMKQEGISLSDLEENAVKRRGIPGGSKAEKLILEAIINEVTDSYETAIYVRKSQPKHLYVDLTDFQYLEVVAKFQFYRRAFEQEQKDFTIAFVLAQRLYPPSHKGSNKQQTPEERQRSRKLQGMAVSIDKKTLSQATKMTKPQFTLILTALRDQVDHDTECAKAFATILPDGRPGNYRQSLHQPLLAFLSDLMCDEAEWIEYFAYELDFGRKYYPGVITFKGQNVKLDTIESLYDMLTESRQVPGVWNNVETFPPEADKRLLARCEKGGTYIASWIPEYTKVYDEDFEGECDYCAAKDDYYWPEGWYEANEYTGINYEIESTITHWMPLPKAPQIDKTT